MNPRAREKEGRLNIYRFNGWEFSKINDRQVTDLSNTKQDKYQEKQSPSYPIFKLLKTLKGGKEKENMYTGILFYTLYLQSGWGLQNPSTETMEARR